MKTNFVITSIFFLLLCFIGTKAQVVFCPPGAEWRYSFYANNMSPQPTFVNESMKYVRDTVVGPDTAKVLKHQRFFYFANAAYYGPSLIKQKGDTVFIRSQLTNHSWQILYNFNTPVGQSWTTYWTFSPYAITFVVDSIQYINFQGHTLKRLVSTGGLHITERYGSNIGLLLNIPGPVTDGDMLYRFLCYSDQDIGTLQFSDLSCNFEGTVGLKKESTDDVFQLYPNPAEKDLKIRVSESVNTSVTIIVSNLHGTEISRFEITNGEIQTIPVTDLASGMYLVSLFQNQRCLKTRKISVIR